MTYSLLDALTAWTDILLSLIFTTGNIISSHDEKYCTFYFRGSDGKNIAESYHFGSHYPSKSGTLTLQLNAGKSCLLANYLSYKSAITSRHH